MARRASCGWGLSRAAGAGFSEGPLTVSEPQRKPPLHAFLSRHKAILGGLVAAACANGVSGYGLQPLVAKGIFEGGNSYIFREWNTFSRVVVAPTHASQPQMWGPSPKLGPDFVVEQRGISIDGDAGTTAFRFTGRLEDIDFLRYDVTNLAYFLPDRASVAIIGIGGGRDLLSAAAFGYRDIT